ncbi:MAG: hypothetical protein ACYC3L_01345 [Gemmatimonadaceae bacterium]
MTLRERLARWLAPDAFKQKRARKAALERLAEPLVALPPLAPVPSTPPVEPPVAPPVEDAPRIVAPVAPEYEAMIALHWGQMPVAATLTRARVKLLQTAHASPHDIRRAIAGTEIVIE